MTFASAATKLCAEDGHGSNDNSENSGCAFKSMLRRLSDNAAEDEDPNTATTERA